MDLKHIDSRLSKRHLTKLIKDMLKETTEYSKYEGHFTYKLRSFFSFDTLFNHNYRWYREFDVRTVHKHGVAYTKDVVRYHIQFEAHYGDGRHWPVKYDFLVYLDDPDHFFPEHDGRRSLTPESIDKWLKYTVLDHDSIMSNGTGIDIYI